MANINITSDAWTEISITSGTVQNISATADIELSAEQTDNSGVVLKPSEIYQWDNETIYARAVTEETGALRVVNFKKAAGGGGGYVLPVASSSTLGGVKVGNNLSIDASGVLSANAGGYTLPPATASTLGGVIIGDNVTVDANGEISVAAPYSLPTAAANTLGGVKIGSNVNVDSDGVISVAAPYTLPAATANDLGGVKIGSNVTVDANGVISVAAPYSLPTATANDLGGVKIGSNITIDANGAISAPAAYTLPTAAANTLGGIKVGSGLSINASGVLSSTGGGSFDIKSLIESNPTYYDRSEMFSSNKTTVTMPEKTNVNVGGHGYILDGDTVDLTDSDNWDDSTYTTAANRAGKDFYIYLCQPTPADSSTTPILILSANSTVPTGYTADNSRKIGGFHCLCADVGTIAGHDLSGYVAGDILPLSVWDLKHRPVSSPEGMVYVEGVGKWFDIYLASWDGTQLVSGNGLTIASGASTKPFHGELFAEEFGKVGKRLLKRDEFIVVAKGSNENTNISGSADPNTTGGHVDTNNRRMISNYGLEDCCGVFLQWSADFFEFYPGGTWSPSDYDLGNYSLQDSPVYFLGIDSQKYGQSYGLLRRGLYGGAWNGGAQCGSRHINCSNFSARGNLSAFGARGISNPLSIA